MTPPAGGPAARVGVIRHLAQCVPGKSHMETSFLMGVSMPCFTEG